LGKGTRQTAQDLVWNAVDKLPTEPNYYGNDDSIVPEPVNLNAGIQLNQEDCEAAGISASIVCQLPIPTVEETKPVIDSSDGDFCSITPSEELFRLNEDATHLNAATKTVKSFGSEPIEILFIIDDSGSMKTLLDIANSIVEETGKKTALRNQKFTYSISTINSKGSDERWGDILYAVKKRFDWEGDTENKVIVAIGDGDNDHDHHSVSIEAAALSQKNVTLHGVHMFTAESGNVIEKIATAGGGKSIWGSFIWAYEYEDEINRIAEALSEEIVSG